MKKAYSITLSIIVAISIIAYIFSTISIHDVGETLISSNINWILIFLVCSLTMSIFSSWRYLLLLNIAGYSAPKFSMYLVVLVRNLFSDLLPARIGTLIYVYLVKTRLAIPTPVAISSFAFAFLFDFIAIAPLILFAALITLGNEQFSTAQFLTIGIILLLVMSAILFLIPKLLPYFLEQTQKLFSDKIRDFLNKINDEIQKVSNARVYGRILILSFGVRLGKYIGMYAVLLALLTPKGYSIQELPFPKIFLGMCAAEMSASLPISGIAGIGAYQGTWITVFSLLGFPLELAKITSISHHVFTQFYGYSIGIAAFLLLLIPIFRRNSPLEFKGMRSVKNFAINFFVISAFAISISLLLVPNEATSENYVKLGEESSLSESKLIVFDAKRDKTFGIFAKDGKNDITVLDTGDRHEIFPTISQDKSMIAFSSAKGSGRFAESNIKIIKLTDKSEIKEIKNGTFPTFTSDINKLIFERDRKSVILFDIHSNEESEIFPASLKESWGNYSVVKPRISPTGDKIAFTSDKGGRWHVWVVDLKSKISTKVSDGCQPYFVSDAEIVFIKNKGAKDGSGIFKADLVNNSVIPLIDTSGEFGHEYFPFISGDLILYSATNKDDHDHETGKYQLFSYDLKSKTTSRLTNDNAGSRWPSFINK